MIAKKQKLKKEKLNYYKLYAEFSVQIRIILDDEKVKISNILQIIIIGLSIVQQLSFIFENYYFNQVEYFGFQYFYFNFSIITRPYIIANKKFAQYSFLISLLIYICSELLILYTFYFSIKQKKQKKILEVIQSQNMLTIIILQVFAYIQSLLYHLTFVIQLELILMSMKYYSTSDNDYMIIGLIGSILTLILLFYNTIIHLYFVQSSLHIKVKNLNLLTQSFYNFWSQIIIFIIVFINSIDTQVVSIKTQFFVITSLLIVKQISCNYNIFTKYYNIYWKIMYDLFFENCSFSITIILLLTKIIETQQQSQNYESIILLLITPIISYISVNYYYKYHNQIMINNTGYINLLLLEYQIANIIYDYGDIKKSFLENNNKTTFILYYQKTHYESCNQIKCLCKNSQEISYEQIIKLYLNDQINTFNLLLNKIRKSTTKQNHFLRYLSFVHYLGLSTRAFQQSSVAMYQESENYSSQMSRAFSKNQKAGSSNSYEHQSSSGQKSRNDIKSEEKFTLIKFDDMNFLQKQKLVVLQDLIKKSISFSLSKSNDDTLEHTVKLFLKSEQTNKQLRNKIIGMIERKKNFLFSLSSSKMNFNLFDQAKHLIIKLINLEEELLKIYLQFPSRKMQALNTFYQGEIMNNYFSAYKLATVTSIADEKLFKMHAQTSFDLFSNKLDYLIIGFDGKSHKLQMRQTSNQIHSFFGFNQEQFKLISNIDHLLPQNFDHIHQKLVYNFLQTGYSKFFRQINSNVCRYQHQFIKYVDFFYDINISNLDDLTFACFLKNQENSNALIFSIQNKISAISKNLLTKIGYPLKVSQQFFNSLKKQTLLRIFPKSHSLMDTSGYQDKFFSTDFDQDQYDQSEYQTIMMIPELNILESNLRINWDSDTQITAFSVDVIFHQRKFKNDSNLSYTIVEIRDAKRNLITTQSTPIQTEHAIPLSYSNFDDIPSIDQDTDELELSVNIPRELILEAKKIKEDPQDDQFGSRFKPNQSDSYYPNASLMSPKDQGLRLIEMKNVESALYDVNINNLEINRKKVIQQFFSAVDQKDGDISSNTDNISQEQSEKSVAKQQQQNQIDKLQMEEIDQDLQENIKQQMQVQEEDQNIVAIDDIGSQVSSVAAFKKSKYSKKYDLIQKFITTEKFSMNYYLARIFLASLLLLFGLFSIIEITLSNQDLERFLQELDMIQIRANVMGPTDNYIVAQNAVMNYAILNLFGMMTLQEEYEKLEYSKNDIFYNYYALKDSFISQLQNPYLTPFFQGKTFNIMQSLQTAIERRNLTAWEALNLQLESAYEFLLLNYTNIFASLDATSGFFIYLFGNYRVFYEQLTLVNQEMLSYSIQRSQNVKDKWIFLLVPILIVGFIMLFICLSFYILYLKFYDTFLHLFSLLEMVWIQRDIDRYKGITQLVIKDSDVLFKYQFMIELKEQFLAAEELRKEKIQQNQKNAKQKPKEQFLNIQQKLSRLPSFIIFTSIYLCGFALCFISNSLALTYFNKYSTTCEYFNTLCDVGVSATGIFSLRQIAYAVASGDTFFFISDDDSQYYLALFKSHIDTIDQFLEQMQSLDTASLITSQAFVTKINSLMESDVCNFLPSSKIESAQSHCDVLYGGVLRRGLQATLSTVRNSLLNEEVTSDNFTVKVYTLDEELETGLICYDALINVKSQFQQELVNFTNELVDQLLIINICAIVFYILVNILLFTTITNIYYEEFKQVIRFIQLLPSTQLFLDSTLDRQLKQIMTLYNLQ